MSIIKDQKLNWTGSEKAEASKAVERKIMTDAQALKLITAIIKKEEAILAEFETFYASRPTSEGSSVIVTSRSTLQQLNRIKDSLETKTK